MRQGDPMDDCTVEGFLAAYPPDVQDLVLRLRGLVLSVMPSVIEQVDPPSKIIAYGYDLTYAGLICAIAPYKAYVNLMFSRGTDLLDPEHLLEGAGKRARHVRIASGADLDRPAVCDLLILARNMSPRRKDA